MNPLVSISRQEETVWALLFGSYWEARWDGEVLTSRKSWGDILDKAHRRWPNAAIARTFSDGDDAYEEIVVRSGHTAHATVKPRLT